LIIDQDHSLASHLKQNLPGRAPRFKFGLRLRRIGKWEHVIGLQLQFAGLSASQTDPGFAIEPRRGWLRNERESAGSQIATPS
jgi:hypothetical protein